MTEQINFAYVLHTNRNLEDVLLNAVTVAKLSADVYISMMSSVGNIDNEVGGSVADSSRAWLGNGFVDMAEVSGLWLDRTNYKVNGPIFVTTFSKHKY